MDEPLTQQQLAELECVGIGTDDPCLRALERALYLEEVLPVVLPDEVLDERHLGTSESALAVLRQLAAEKG